MKPDRLIYVADPMCSWCWGFAPVMAALEALYLSRCELSLIVGGLRPGPHARPLDSVFRAELAHHWDQVEARTGQPFTRKLLERNDFLYDTEPAAQAVVTVRSLAPELEYAYFYRLQEAFYVRNDDITRRSTLTALAATLGLEETAFTEAYDKVGCTRLAWEDFAAARDLGVQGFPTLLLERKAALHLITRGYQPLEPIRSLLNGLLDS
ncbi:MAG: DsbA family protein [Candidatus Competibacteraceae bacterium]|nr:DsbA family protein [Candidatus Competibacteraceae bacterium]